MSTYPPILGAAVQPKQHRKHHRLNQIYGTPQVASTRKQPRQTKGPNMFKRMIKGLITWSMQDNHHNEPDIALQPDEHRLSATGIKFEVYRANGGTVIETRRADRRTGDSLYELHVISGDQDIGAEIGKIITMEALKA
jgi:hypothetical protein